MITLKIYVYTDPVCYILVYPPELFFFFFQFALNPTPVLELFHIFFPLIYGKKWYHDLFGKAAV